MSSYFPVSLRIDNKKILLVGAGNISAFKLDKIQMFNPQAIRVIAKEFSEPFMRLKQEQVECIQKPFVESDIEGFDIVIVAIENHELQREIYQLCQRKKILCNCVDLIDCCDFIFPSIVKRGDITIAINSNGRLPGFSAVFKTYIEKFMPLQIEEKFEEIVKLRAELPPGPDRMKHIRQKAQNYFDSIMGGEK